VVVEVVEVMVVEVEQVDLKAGRVFLFLVELLFVQQ
jgi:hypothetical protein